MRIVTYNVNSINARLPNLLRWLAESSPDVVCLQELKAPQDKFPETAIRAAGYGVIWHGQKSWNGVAILTRGADPVESRRGLAGDDEDLQSRYIEAVVYQGVSENMASEQSARMVAMKSASDNAATLIDELTLVYNKSRQASITKELSEIVAGAAAV